MSAVYTHKNRLYEAILMSTHDIHLKYRTPKRYPTIISIVPSGVALLVIIEGSNYRSLEKIFMVPKGFEPSKFECILFQTINSSVMFHYPGKIQVCEYLLFLVLLF